MLKTLKPLLLASLLAPVLVHAEGEAPTGVAAKGEAPTSVAAKGMHLFLGAGLFSEMMNVNAEHVNDYGNFMLRMGKFRKKDGLAANLSWRRHIDGVDGYRSGVYVGVFGGHVQAESIGGEDYLRLGIGGEMGYHWVKEYTRSELTVGLGAAEPLDENGVEYKAEPTLFISYTMALGY